MSRIADVLRKAREESDSSEEPRGAGDAGLRARSEVKVPWPLIESATVAAAPSPNVSSPRAIHSSAEHHQDSPVLRPAAARVEPTITPTAPPDTIGELVQRLFIAKNRRGANVRRVLVIPVDDSLGAIELAVAVAEKLAGATTATVCLADLDLRQPTLHLRYPLEGKSGLTDALAQPGPLRACAHQAGSISNLWLLPAGPPQMERSTFDDAPTKRRLSNLLETFDFVVGSTASVGLYPETGLLGPVFDSVVLLAHAVRTRPEALRAVDAVLEGRNITVVGTILRHTSANFGLAPATA